ncbi:MAG TPA: hypothetical protein VN226_10445 [Anaerolineales bacterium]|nr:hypothetical protein [Anaerolineales bacterium]
MDIEELAKKIEWLEREQRKDKATINSLKQTQTETDNTLSLLQTQNKDLAAELKRAQATESKFTLIDKQLQQNRAELNKTLQDLEKRRIKIESDASEQRKLDAERTNKTIQELRGMVDSFNDLRPALKLVQSEDQKTSLTQQEFEKKLKDLITKQEELALLLRTFEEIRKTDQKRLVELQGDLIATRKRSEEGKEKVELNFDNIQALDNRINELLLSEGDRRQSQAAFMEKINGLYYEREKEIRNAIQRFESIVKQRIDLDEKILKLDNLEVSLTRIRDNFNEINSRFERRINEITEIQRLSEEKYRQEWMGLKADDQKRWTNFTLLQDDNIHNVDDKLEKLENRLTRSEDTIQSLSDLINLTNEVTESQFQNLMNWSHEYLAKMENLTGKRS